MSLTDGLSAAEVSPGPCSTSGCYVPEISFNLEQPLVFHDTVLLKRPKTKPVVLETKLPSGFVSFLPPGVI